jgi:hypothetical protein
MTAAAAKSRMPASAKVLPARSRRVHREQGPEVHSEPEREVTVAAVSVAERLRWTLTIVAAMVDLCPNKVRALERRGEFPPRVAVDGKEQFIPDEVRAWAAGRDWRALVAERRKLEGSHAT